MPVDVATLLARHGFPEVLGEEALAPCFRAARGDAAALRALLREVGPRRYAFALLDPGWCASLARRVAALVRDAELRGLRWEAPNSMNRYGAVLQTETLDADDPGARTIPMLVDVGLLREALLPLTGALFHDHDGARLDHHHAFVVSYAMGGDVDLGFHADDAEVTLNVHLGGDFVGGDLWFEGPRCALHRDGPSWPQERGRWAHVPGEALLHAGSDRHGAYPIERGRRDNLIVWMRSRAARHADGWRPDGVEEACPRWCASSRQSGLS